MEINRSRACGITFPVHLMPITDGKMATVKWLNGRNLVVHAREIVGSSFGSIRNPGGALLRVTAP